MLISPLCKGESTDEMLITLVNYLFFNHRIRIGIFDSIVSNMYISGCNYTFYAHSNSKKTKSFMSEVRALDKKLFEYAVKEYGKDEVGSGFELDDDKIALMERQVEELIQKMHGLNIVLILDCFD